MNLEFVQTPWGSGWVECAPSESFNPAAYQAAQHNGYVDMDAHILARMSRTHTLPKVHTESTPWQGAFQPLAHPELGLYLIVDSADWVERALRAGCRTVQLRIKSNDPCILTAEIERSVAIARHYQNQIAHSRPDQPQTPVQLFINDHWELALKAQAYGIHLGQEDIAAIGYKGLDTIAHAGARLGISTHCYFEVCRALALTPSYIACGPIYPTAAKAMPWIPQGSDNLAYWCHHLKTPIVAIAGMTPARAEHAMQCGAASVAVISAITQAPNPEAAIAEFQAAIQRGQQQPKIAPPAYAKPTLKPTSPTP